MATPRIAYTATDLDEFAALLTDLAAAILARDTAAVWSAVCEIRGHDNDLSAVLADFLTFAGLTCEEVTP
ncbi:hypothetical protein WEI85_18065 [Actinomycetes bacterium KLBMP 9797]